MRFDRLFFVNLVIGFVIALGFAVNGYIHHLSDLDFFEDETRDMASLASESLYARIDHILYEPINIVLTMANDTLLKNLLREERDGADYIREMQKYLNTYKVKYDYDTVFLASEKGKRYYYEEGLSRSIDDRVEERWYYNFLKDPRECYAEVDTDTAHNYDFYAYTNCKIYDDDGTVMGVVGMGMEKSYLRDIIREYDKKFDVAVYLVNAGGGVEVSSREDGVRTVNLFEQEPLVRFRDEILAIRVPPPSPSQPAKLELSDTVLTFSDQRDGVRYIYSVRYMPSFAWYLISVNDTAALDEAFDHEIVTSFIVGLVTIVVIIFIVIRIVMTHNRRVTGILTRDPITGVRNRSSYEETINYYAKSLKPGQQFGLGIVDLNNLKMMNDVHGHEAGDRYLAESSRVICEAFPHNPIFRIGGDEFAIIFDGMDEKTVDGLHTAMLERVARFNAEHTMKLSLAFGYAFLVEDGDRDLAALFKRADARMYANKQAMKAEQAKRQEGQK